MATKRRTDVTLVAAMLAALTLLGCGVEGEDVEQRGDVAAVEQDLLSGYYLPFKAGTARTCTRGACGNPSGGGHCGDATFLKYNNYSFDWSMPRGTPLYASKGGTVQKTSTSCKSGMSCWNGGDAGCASGQENFVEIRIDGTNYVHAYGHMDSVAVTTGEKIKAGQYIGTSGMTGCAYGAHLHTGVRVQTSATADWYTVEFGYVESSGVPQCGTGTLYTSQNSGTGAQEPSGSIAKRTDVAMFYQGAGSNIHVWRTLGSEFAHAGTPYLGAASYLDDVGDRMVAGDFNGDGKDDIATFAQGSSLNATDGKMRINVWLATGSSDFAAPGVWYTSSGSFTLSLLGGRVVAGDFNGDGKDDLAAFYKNGSSGAILYRWQSTGSGFSSPTGVWNVASGYNLDNVGSRMVAGDFDIDGRDDIANVYRVSSTEYRIHVWRSTGTSFYPSGSQASVAWIAMTNTIDVNTVAGRVAAGDFNTGGKVDIAMMQTYGTDGARIIACQSGGTSFLGCSYKWVRPDNYDLANVGDRFAAGDFNKDGVFDVATAYQIEPGVIKLNVWPGGADQALMDPEYWWDSTMPPNYSYTLSNVGGRFVTGNWSGD